MMSGDRIPFESHLHNLKEPTRTIMIDLRNFAKSLGTNVIEEVRPHRVVYAKTMNFRIFLDIEPSGESLVLTLRYGKSGPPVATTIKTEQDAENIKNRISEAYQKIQ